MNPSAFSFSKEKILHIIYSTEILSPLSEMQKAHWRAGYKNTSVSCKGERKPQLSNFRKTSGGKRSLQSGSRSELPAEHPRAGGGLYAQLTQNPGPKNSTGREKGCIIYAVQ